jgi:hypothetical protein
VRAEAVEDLNPDTNPAAGEGPRHDPAHSTPGAKRDADAGVPGRGREDEGDEDTGSYGVHEAEATPDEKVPEEVVRPRADEMALLSRSDAPRRPRRVWGPDLLAFLGQPGTISAVVVASGLCTVVGVMVRVARAFNPVSGD